MKLGDISNNYFHGTESHIHMSLAYYCDNSATYDKIGTGY